MRLCADWDHRGTLGEAEGDAAVRLMREELYGQLYHHRCGTEKEPLPCGMVPPVPLSGTFERDNQERPMPSVREMVASGGRVMLFAEVPCRAERNARDVIVNSGLAPLWCAAHGEGGGRKFDMRVPIL